MDKEVFYILTILQNADRRLNTGDISKAIFEKFQTRISKKIVQNYLWSYFRNDIDYMPEEYTYLLKDQHHNFSINDDIKIVRVSTSPRPININTNTNTNTNTEGTKITVEYNDSIPIDKLLQAIGYLYLNGLNDKHDLIKNINRAIENL